MSGTKISRQDLLETMMCVCLSSGSVTRALNSCVTLTWQNSTGGRTTLSPLVNEDAEQCMAWAIEHGVLVIDYFGCDENKVTSWAINGPLMAELFEEVPKPEDDLGAKVLGTAFSKIDAYEWCRRAKQACGVIIHNVPAPRGWRTAETSTEECDDGK